MVQEPEKTEKNDVDLSASDQTVEAPQSSVEEKPKKSEKLRGLTAVATRNIFYRDGYRQLTQISLILASAVLVLIIALAVTISQSRPQDRFFATTSDGRLVQMVPLNQANLNDAAIVSWAARSSSDIMTFGFHDYQRRLQESAQYFTRRGWQSFSEALEAAGLLEMIQERRQVVTAAPRRAPIIVQQGVVNGIYRWVVELPLIVTYQSGSSKDSQNLNVRLLVIRTPTLDSPSGVGIQQWIAR